jgi:hypothetical protein
MVPVNLIESIVHTTAWPAVPYSDWELDTSLLYCQLVSKHRYDKVVDQVQHRERHHTLA